MELEVGPIHFQEKTLHHNGRTQRKSLAFDQLFQKEGKIRLQKACDVGRAQVAEGDFSACDFTVFVDLSFGGVVLFGENLLLGEEGGILKIERVLDGGGLNFPTNNRTNHGPITTTQKKAPDYHNIAVESRRRNRQERGGNANIIEH